MALLVFMLGENSAKVLLDILLPKLLPADIPFICIPHEGKQDLEKSIPVKLKHWNVPDTWFVIIRDKDQSDLSDLKTRLEQLCVRSGRPESLIRIAVHELESWFLGDLTAVGKAFHDPKLAAKQQGKKFRHPDLLANASQELERLVKGYQKVAGARAIGPHLTPQVNTSISFQQLISGLAAYTKQIQAQQWQSQ